VAAWLTALPVALPIDGCTKISIPEALSHSGNDTYFIAILALNLKSPNDFFAQSQQNSEAGTF
jgi:hypothetical protein